MPAQQAKTRPATIGKQYQLLPVIGPSAGIDLRSSPTLMAPERARTLVNFSLEEPGALVVRPGYVKFSTSSLGSSRLQGGQRVYLNTAIPAAASTMLTLMAFGGSVYSLSDSGGWSSVLLTGLNATNEIYFPHDRDMVAALDGASTAIFKSTNGSSWTRFGIASGPASSCSSKSGGAFQSASEYEFTYTYKDRDLAVESNGATTVSTLTMGSTGAVEVQCPNSTDAQVDAIVVYARNKTSGETVKRKASSFAMQGGAHSTITLISTTWGTNDEVPTDHDLPSVLSFGVVWKNRWWARDATTTNRIHFTQLFQPQSWPALFYIDIPFERGDAIQALVPLGDILLVFGTTKVFAIIGQTSLDFEVRPTIGSQDGAFGPRSVAVIENAVVHASATGVYAFDGTTDKLLSFDIEPGWRDLVENAAASDLSRVACVTHQKRKELRIAVPKRYPSGTFGEWVMDLGRSRGGETAWTETDRNLSFYMLWDGPESVAGNRGRLFAAESTRALVFEEATGTTANSSNLTAEYEGPGLTLGSFRGRWVDLRGEYEPHGGALAIEAVVDGVSMGSQTVNIGSGLSVYGTGQYGTAQYSGAGRRQFFKNLPLKSDGRTFVLKMIYVGQERFKLYSYHSGLVPETRSRAFSE